MAACALAEPNLISFDLDIVQNTAKDKNLEASPVQTLVSAIESETDKEGDVIKNTKALWKRLKPIEEYQI